MGRYSFQRISICPFCGKVLHSGGGQHIYLCKERPSNLSKTDIAIQYCIKNFPLISKKDVLFSEYEINLMSLPDLERKYNIPSGKIILLLDYYNIHKRNVSESCLKIAQPKIKETCLERYGATNVLSKNTPIYHKRNKTIMDKYGVTTVFKTPEVIKKILDDKTYIDRYGMTRKELRRKQSKETWEHLSEKQKVDWVQKSINSDKSIINNVPSISRLEKIVFDSLQRLKIPVEQQFLLLYNHNWRYYDIRILDTNILIEVNGDFYHANPNIYKEDDIMIYLNKQIPALCVWENEINKQKFAESLGYEIVYIWESEIRSIKRYNNIAFDKFVLQKINKLGVFNNEKK